MALRRDSAPQLMMASRPCEAAAAQTRSARSRRSSDVSRGISLTIPVASPSTCWSSIQRSSWSRAPTSMAPSSANGVCTTGRTPDS